MIEPMPTPPRVALPSPRRARPRGVSSWRRWPASSRWRWLIDPAAPAAWEVDLARSIQEIGFPGWTPFIDVTEFLSRPLVVSLLAAAIGLACLRWGRRRQAAILAGALLVWAPERLITELVARERPTEAALVIIREGYGFAFPSGHTTGALVIYGALLLILLGSRYRGRPAALGACALAAAGLAGAAVGRVALGAHWPTDVLGAALLSGCWLIALHWADRRWLAPRWPAPQSTAQPTAPRR